MQNVFVTQAHNLELARLAIGDFGAAQEGVETVSRACEQTDERHKAPCVGNRNAG